MKITMLDTVEDTIETPEKDLPAHPKLNGEPLRPLAESARRGIVTRHYRLAKGVTYDAPAALAGRLIDVGFARKA